MNPVFKYLFISALFVSNALNGQPYLFPKYDTLVYSGKVMIYKGEKVNVFDNHPTSDKVGFVHPQNLTDGRYFVFYTEDTSKIALEITVKNYKLNGTKKEYYLDGNIEWLTDYKNDTIEGSNIRYRPNGSIEHSEPYQNGKLNGLLQKYHSNGVKKLEVMYKDGKEQKVQKEWNDKGELIRETYYKNGVYISSKDIKGEK